VACGQFAAVGLAGGAYRSTAADGGRPAALDAAARRSAANAISVTFVADVGGGTDFYLLNFFHSRQYKHALVV